jgi:hypothetical protein
MIEYEAKGECVAFKLLNATVDECVSLMKLATYESRDTVVNLRNIILITGRVQAVNVTHGRLFDPKYGTPLDSTVEVEILPLPRSFSSEWLAR